MPVLKCNPPNTPQPYLMLKIPWIPPCHPRRASDLNPVTVYTNLLGWGRGTVTSKPRKTCQPSCGRWRILTMGTPKDGCTPSLVRNPPPPHPWTCQLPQTLGKLIKKKVDLKNKHVLFFIYTHTSLLHPTSSLPTLHTLPKHETSWSAPPPPPPPTIQLSFTIPSRIRNIQDAT